MLTKILKGSRQQKSRLHDHKGNLVPTGRLIANAPRAFVSGLFRVLLGHRPRLPWISYSATLEIAAFLSNEKRVLEYGSGMSTLWYAKHAGQVVSVENFRPWYDQVRSALEKDGINNVEYHLAESIEEYTRVPCEGGFDLVMVDGSFRDRCTAAALATLRPGGIFYLDNSDRMALPGSDEAAAAELALKYAKDHNCTVTYFTDFAPTQFFAQEGMMVRRPA
ncbi:O-methyltransferase [Stakelama saccharophila]|uniref:Class I SAM-dependent methyltransferase n=1 Tax=Stakelama saccharophila TaxID=3075605 RepID=A0ABZ0B8S4_9SPHN|nr:class I SAM-dependent methyltransferase [Stakelama sp. W311]WNO53789.1 class I SAM-dependent methyltransferase [Stakelama sp. W311]